MIEIVSEKVVRPSRLFLTCSYHQRWGSQPVLTQPVLTDTMCTHAHRTLAAVHPPSDTPPALHAHAEQSKRGKHLCCASFSPPLPPASMARLRTPSPLLARPLPTLTLSCAPAAHRSAVQPAAVAQSPIAAVRIEQFPDVLRSLARRVVLKNTGWLWASWLQGCIAHGLLYCTGSVAYGLGCCTDCCPVLCRKVVAETLAFPADTGRRAIPLGADSQMVKGHARVAGRAVHRVAGLVAARQLALAHELE